MFKCYLILILFLFKTSLSFASQAIMVPNRDIKKGEIVKADDFLYDIMPLSSSKHYILEADAYALFHQYPIYSVKAIRRLEEGKPIKRSDLHIDNIVIRKGDIVKVKFMKKNLTIELPCVALSNAGINDSLKLKNTNSNKILTGIVLDDHSVAIKDK